MSQFEQPVVGQNSAFLNLPLEIRLAIYRWVHLDHQVQDAQLDDAYPNPTWKEFCTKTICMKFDLDNAVHDDDGLTAPSVELKQSRQLACRRRPVCRIPSSLLVTSKQIYLESRTISFLENEFVFVDWFSPGLSAALAFAKNLRSWQREILRYMRLDILILQLQNGGTGTWNEFCQLFSDGLQALRLRVRKTTRPRTYQATGENKPRSNMAWEKDNLILKYPPESFVAAFKGFRALEDLEIELSDESWGLIAKGRWCDALHKLVNGSRTPERAINIVGIESEM
ncbi:hypothetical protein NM208_g7615 [Fusarium decemcellulare]|uniref:Uncharacterized protein n=1 Tax=Fusarium decemcellulare TaxID=57161 RepID=A0ACC1S8D1_9HYPO|nr:hypothetical protein NM208_g7615 [Fusarium decemcellulare]